MCLFVYGLARNIHRYTCIGGIQETACGNTVDTLKIRTCVWIWPLHLHRPTQSREHATCNFHNCVLEVHTRPTGHVGQGGGGVCFRGLLPNLTHARTNTHTHIGQKGVPFVGLLHKTPNNTTHARTHTHTHLGQEGVPFVGLLHKALNNTTHTRTHTHTPLAGRSALCRSAAQYTEEHNTRSHAHAHTLGRKECPL